MDCNCTNPRPWDAVAGCAPIPAAATADNPFTRVVFTPAFAYALRSDKHAEFFNFVHDNAHRLHITRKGDTIFVGLKDEEPDGGFTAKSLLDALAEAAISFREKHAAILKNYNNASDRI